MELTSIGKRTQDLASTISWILQSNDENYVYWAEVGRNKGQVEINARPLDVSEQLRDSLFEMAETVVATSATLSVGGQGGLAPFMRDVGMEEGTSLSLGSPFDYSRNVKLRVPTWLEEPDNSEDYAESVAEATLDYIKRSDGAVFVLCTSYAFMNKIHDQIVERLERLRFPTFLQGGSLPRGAMIEEFKKDRRSVLFGTASFWEGVDVPGDALRMVIITRLPFPVPTAPLFAARAKQMRERGENDFAGLSLPEAIIRFKQGFGRLIRTESDQGAVVVMDTRIVTKSYGRRFLKSLPDCQVIQD
jgi:ATP-dependent DNA helicase DinG